MSTLKTLVAFFVYINAIVLIYNMSKYILKVHFHSIPWTFAVYIKSLGGIRQDYVTIGLDVTDATLRLNH